MHQKNAQYYNIILNAALEAGAEIMRFFGRDPEVTIKADDSPVTLADRNAHDIIYRALHTTALPVISEEMELPPYEERSAWKAYWLVDPLDGTKSFIKGREDFTVNIALMIENRPVMGVIYIPCQRSMYLGDVQSGKAYTGVFTQGGTHSDPFTVMQPLVKAPEPEQMVVAVSRSHPDKRLQAYLDKLRNKKGQIEILPLGSSLKFCSLAEGAVAAYPRFSPCMEWDTAAGHALCAAMGVEIYQMGTQTPLKYNKRSLVNPPFEAYEAGNKSVLQ